MFTEYYHQHNVSGIKSYIAIDYDDDNIMTRIVLIYGRFSVTISFTLSSVTTTPVRNTSEKYCLQQFCTEFLPGKYGNILASYSPRGNARSVINIDAAGYKSVIIGAGKYMCERPFYIHEGSPMDITKEPAMLEGIGK